MLLETPPVYLFLPDDLRALEERIQKISQDIRELQETMAESTRQSSETWHDNFMFEEGNRQLDVLHKELAELQSVVTHAHIPSPQEDSILGKVIHYRDEATQKEHTLTIGSYLLLTPRPFTASYHSPLGKLFSHAVPGKVLSGMIGGVPRHYFILSLDS